MKLRTNFLFSFDRLIPVLIVFFWGTALLALLASLTLAGDALRFCRENPRLKVTLDNLRKNPLEPVKVEQPSIQEERDFKKRLSDLNALQAVSQSPLSHLARLEDLLPADARLLNFQDDLETGDIQLAAETLNLKDLSQFMSALEKDGTFSKVTLTKQSQSSQGNWVQFSLEMAGSP